MGRFKIGDAVVVREWDSQYRREYIEGVIVDRSRNPNVYGWEIACTNTKGGRVNRRFVDVEEWILFPDEAVLERLRT